MFSQSPLNVFGILYRQRIRIALNGIHVCAHRLKHTAVIHLRGKPRTPQDANDIAVSEMKRGNLQEALNIFTLILAKAPHPIIYMNQGLALQGMKRHDTAVASFERAISLAHDFAGAYNNRGISLHALGRYDEALAS